MVLRVVVVVVVGCIINLLWVSDMSVVGVEEWRSASVSLSSHQTPHYSGLSWFPASLQNREADSAVSVTAAIRNILNILYTRREKYENHLTCFEVGISGNCKI